MKWPLRELLVSYLATVQRAARAAYETEMANYYRYAPHVKKAEAPTVPDILRPRKRGASLTIEKVKA